LRSIGEAFFERRIKSQSGLESLWEENYLRAMAIEEGFLKGVYKK
jgi:hypothetical protein